MGLAGSLHYLQLFFSRFQRAVGTRDVYMNIGSMVFGAISRSHGARWNAPGYGLILRAEFGLTSVV